MLTSMKSGPNNLVSEQLKPEESLTSIIKLAKKEKSTVTNNWHLQHWTTQWGKLIDSSKITWLKCMASYGYRQMTRQYASREPKPTGAKILIVSGIMHSMNRPSDPSQPQAQVLTHFIKHGAWILPSSGVRELEESSSNIESSRSMWVMSTPWKVMQHRKKKVELAGLSLGEKADTWFQQCQAAQGTCMW